MTKQSLKRRVVTKKIVVIFLMAAELRTLAILRFSLIVKTKSPKYHRIKFENLQLIQSL